MMNPIFLSPPNTEDFNHNQDQYHQEDPQQQLLATSSPFCQSLASDQLKASEDLFHNAESPSYGAQMSTTDNSNGSYNNHDLFIFKHQEDHEPKNLCGSGVINSNRRPKIDPIGGSRITSSSQTLDQSPYLGINSETNGNNNVIMVCSNCNTSKTPLWRSGPQGPKSLCNACGIRQRKARKAAIKAAAAAAINSSCEISSSTYTKTFKINKDKKQSRATTNKKQTSFSNEQANQLADSDQTNGSSKRQLRFEEFAVNLLSKNAALQPMFPQDVWEGALLLMSLSYGLTDQC